MIGRVRPALLACFALSLAGCYRANVVCYSGNGAVIYQASGVLVEPNSHGVSVYAKGGTSPPVSVTGACVVTPTRQ